MIEGKGVHNVQALHHRETRRIGEREVLVVVLKDDCSRPLLVGLANANDGDVIAINLREDRCGDLATGPRQEQRMRFGPDKVGCREAPPFPPKAAFDGTRGRCCTSRALEMAKKAEVSTNACRRMSGGFTFIPASVHTHQQDSGLCVAQCRSLPPIARGR